MGKIKLPGLIVLLVGSAITTLVNYFSAGGAGFEWLYAPIALSVLGVISKALTVQTPEQPTPQRDAGGPTPRGTGRPTESKMSKFLWG